MLSARKVGVSNPLPQEENPYNSFGVGNRSSLLPIGYGNQRLGWRG